MISDQPTQSPEPVSHTAGVIEQPAVDQRALVIDPDNPPWALSSWMGVIKAVATWIGSVGFLFFVPLILVIPYLIYIFAQHGGPQGGDLMADKTFLLLSVVAVIPAHFLTFLVAYFVITSARRYPFSQTVGLEWPSSLGAWAGVGLCILIAGALILVGILITWLFGGDKKTDLDLIIESSFQARLVTVFLAVFTAPIVEEVVYRGMLYPAFARVMHPAFAIILVSLLFAGVHFYQYRNNLAVIAVITILSASLTTVRAVTHRLLPSFVIHLVFNGIQSIMILAQGLRSSEPITPPPVPGVELISFALLHLS